MILICLNMVFLLLTSQVIFSIKLPPAKPVVYLITLSKGYYSAKPPVTACVLSIYNQAMQASRIRVAWMSASEIRKERHLFPRISLALIQATVELLLDLWVSHVQIYMIMNFHHRPLMTISYTLYFLSSYYEDYS